MNINVGRSIRFAVLGLSIIPLLFLLVFAGALWWLQGQAESASVWAQHSDDVIEQETRVRDDLVLEGNRISASQVRSRGRVVGTLLRLSKTMADADTLQRMVRDNPVQLANAVRLTHDIRTLTDASSALMADQLRQLRLPVAQRVYPYKLAKDALAASDEFSAQFKRFNAEEVALRIQRRAASTRSWHLVGALLLIGTLVGVALALFLSLAYGNRVVARLGELARAAANFASTGHIPKGLAGSDEIAQLSREFNRMALQVKEREGTLVRYQVLVEQVRDAILFVRVDNGRIVEANRAATKMYGYTYDILLGKSLRDLYIPEEQDEMGEKIARPDVRELFLETDHLTADGRTFPVEVAVQKATIDNQAVAICIVRDVTERRASEATVKQALHQAVEASRLKSEFLATMSHEIRTPMNGVIGMTDLLLGTKLTGEQTEFALMARDSAHSLLGIINNILDLSKIEAGKVELELISFELLSQIESAAGMLVAQAKEKRLSLMTYVDPSITPWLFGDPVRLRQVLVNLVANAIKFTSKGGVALYADLVSQTRDEVRVHFAVRDTGIGIAPEALPTLFEPFRQADGSTTRRYGGTGLGLTISKQFVELMGGRIKVDSQLGKGSVFSFALDFKASPELHARPERGDLRGLRAIVVDDDVLSRDILSRYLTSWGMYSAVAESAAEAMQMMHVAAERGTPFDIALIDFRMPTVDGLELGRNIKADERICAAHLVLVTAYDAPTQGEIAIDIGFSAYITKPVRQSQLYDSIADSLLGPSLTEAHVNNIENVTMEKKRESLILLAEDNAVNQHVAIRQLEKLGYGVIAVGNGRDAVEQAATGRFALVLMDCQMPEMDGFDAARHIRKREMRTGRRIPIIAMTANALSRDRDACLAAGMDDYLSKPVGLTELRAVLERWLPETDATNVQSPFNRERLTALLGDDSDTIADIVRLAVTSLPEIVARINESRQDVAMAARYAHQLKGGAGNVGAEEIAHIATMLERELEIGWTGQAHAVADMLQNALSRFLESAQAAIEGTGTAEALK